MSSPALQEEAYRLETQNRVFNLVFDGRLIFPPVTGPSNVLDCGYGAASWAVELAESYPDCQASLFPCCDKIARSRHQSGHRSRHLAAIETGRNAGKL